MARVLTCVDFDEAAQVCNAESWTLQESQPIPDWYPTIDQAQSVGGTMFTALVIIASLSLLLPPREKEE